MAGKPASILRTSIVTGSQSNLPGQRDNAVPPVAPSNRLSLCFGTTETLNISNRKLHIPDVPATGSSLPGSRRSSLKSSESGSQSDRLSRGCSPRISPRPSDSDLLALLPLDDQGNAPASRRSSASSASRRSSFATNKSPPCRSPIPKAISPIPGDRHTSQLDSMCTNRRPSQSGEPNGRPSQLDARRPSDATFMDKLKGLLSSRGTEDDELSDENNDPVDDLVDDVDDDEDQDVVHKKTTLHDAISKKSMATSRRGLNNHSRLGEELKRMSVAQRRKSSIRNVGKRISTFIRGGHHEDPDSLDALISSMEQTRWIHSPGAQIAFGFAIILNAALVGAETDYGNARGTSSLMPGWVAVRVLFLVLFSVELSLRAEANRCAGLRDHWTLLDLCLLVVGAIDILIVVIVQDPHNLKRLRPIRLVQLARVLRLFDFIPDLMILIKGIWSALKALLWTLLLIMVVIYVSAVLVTSLVGRGPQVAEQPLLHEWFGSVGASMLTLFQLMTLEDWPRVVRTVIEGISPLWCVYFIPFIIFTNFALLNLVTAVVIEQVFDIAEKEAQRQAKVQERERLRTMRKLQQLFEDMDEDGNGTLDADEFESALQDQCVLDQFMQLGIAKHEAAELFQCLDVDGKEQLSVEEFVDGCFRTQGVSKAKHMLQVHYDLHRSRKALHDDLGTAQEMLDMRIRAMKKKSSEEEDGSKNHPGNSLEGPSNRLAAVKKKLKTVDHRIGDALSAAKAACVEVDAARSAQQKVLHALRTLSRSPADKNST